MLELVQEVLLFASSTDNEQLTATLVVIAVTVQRNRPVFVFLVVLGGSWALQILIAHHTLRSRDRHCIGGTQLQLVLLILLK